jgi:hypothetical protein
MTRYKMTVVFDVHEDVGMKHRFVERIDRDIYTEELDHRIIETSGHYDDTQPHINKLYEDVLERIETSSNHPITYEIVSFDKLQ